MNVLADHTGDVSWRNIVYVGDGVISQLRAACGGIAQNDWLLKCAVGQAVEDTVSDIGFDEPRRDHPKLRCAFYVIVEATPQNHLKENAYVLVKKNIRPEQNWFVSEVLNDAMFGNRMDGIEPPRSNGSSLSSPLSDSLKDVKAKIEDRRSREIDGVFGDKDPFVVLYYDETNTNVVLAKSAADKEGVNEVVNQWLSDGKKLDRVDVYQRVHYKMKVVF